MCSIVLTIVSCIMSTVDVFLGNRKNTMERMASLLAETGEEQQQYDAEPSAPALPIDSPNDNVKLPSDAEGQSVTPMSRISAYSMRHRMYSGSSDFKGVARKTPKFSEHRRSQSVDARNGAPSRVQLDKRTMSMFKLSNPSDFSLMSSLVDPISATTLVNAHEDMSRKTD